VIIRKGNPDGLVCWRTMHAGPTVDMPIGARCIAERCVAYCPRQTEQRRQVSDDERDALLSAGMGWDQLSISLHRPSNDPRVTMRRFVDTDIGDCLALPSLNDNITE
jgi:hypothetical protein